MAVYKIFPSSDATIYSAYPAKNTGLDEILEVSVKNSKNPSNYFVDPVENTPLLQDDLRRSLLKFSNEDIQLIQSLYTGSWKTDLRMFLANADNLKQDYTIEFKQLDSDWQMGTGKYDDDPETRNGVCWYNSGSFSASVNNWYTPEYYLTPGGGSWTNVSASQSFNPSSVKDINVDVSNIVTTWFSSINDNNGILVKHPQSVENNSNSYVVLSFFSIDTHTIYPPCLEMKWDDSSYDSGSLQPIVNSNCVVTIDNNPYNIKTETTRYQFRINARDRFPARVFSTSSIYLNNKRLPSSSYWAIQDVKTEDMIIDFDDNYTKVSCDPKGNYFNLYAKGLQPERYYKILIKSTLDSGETVVFDHENVFKIVR